MAVLYFDNVTRDSADAYLADGLTESIILRLGGLERLQVKSRGAVRAYRGQTPDPTEAGAKLAVSYLVTGSVRRVERRLRVTVELVRSSSGVQLWGRQFDQQDDDVLTLEQEIAASVASSIAGRLLPRESAALAARPTNVPEAYNQVLRGHYYLAQRTGEGTALALTAYQAASRADPGFVQARARAAYAYALAVAWHFEINGLAPDSTRQLGLAAATRVLRADSSSSDAWLALGVLMAYSPRGGDWRGVMSALDRAVALDPRSPEIHHIRGWALYALSRDSEARDEWRRALALERERPVTYWYLASVSYIARQYPQCVVLADSALALDRTFAVAHAKRAMCLASTGDLDRARMAASDAALLASGAEAEAEATMAMAYIDRLSGDTAAIRRRLVGLQATRTGESQLGKWYAYQLATLHAALGERDLAIAAADRLRDTPGTIYTSFRHPFWDSLRGYAPFARLLAALNPSLR